jgi:putative ABC transport system ATP-binding protein
MTAVLRVIGLRKTYEADGAPVRALRGVDLTLEQGEFVAVMGPSGCGKSTLLNLVAGLDTPSAGEIALAGESLTGMSEDELARFRRRHVGMIFQFFNLLDGMSALENVVLAGLIAGLSRMDVVYKARDALNVVSLGGKADHPPELLSGGERQRLAIARALVTEPTLLMADEPTGALDSEGGAEILEVFRRLNNEGQTVLMVTHDGSVADVAARIVHMRDGAFAQPAAASAQALFGAR